MGCCCKCVTVIAGLVALFFGYKVYSVFFTVPEVPNLPLNQWWGPGKAVHDANPTIKAMKIEFTADMINDLKDRLNRARYHTEPLEGIGFQYGFNNDHLKNIVEHWQNKYNFAEREKMLNKYPHYYTTVQGLKIHYVHVKPAVKNEKLKVYPLLMLHGWPGSFVEFYKVIPLLTTPRKGNDFVFELIIPSLPGYGFSQGASKPGLGAAQVGVVMKNLMAQLGFKKYVIQGGDWGSVIGSDMAIMFPDEVIGYHSNMANAMSPLGNLAILAGNFMPSLVTTEEHYSKVSPLSGIFSHVLEESGYFHLQATKPDTIGVALRDSPVGLAAYIIEKFSTWTDKSWRNLKDGGLTKKFTVDELLDNIMIYWSTNTITTSVRLYSETINKAQFALEMDSIPTNVPTSVTRCGHEIFYPIDFVLKQKYKRLVQITDYANCGHFLAYEEPTLLAEDVWNSLPKFIKANAGEKNKNEL